VKVTLTQHPVGQGGMASGMLERDGQTTRWVYDCGSNQSDALAREVRAMAAGGTLDLLFLSHLDSDHVSGVDRLMTLTPPKEVILPLLSPLQRLIVVAKDAAEGRLTGDFVRFAEDPAGWLAGRGAGTVTFVDGNGDGPAGGERPGPIFPFDAPSVKGRTKAWWTVPTSSRRGRGETEVRIAASGATLGITEPWGFDWLFAPYVHRPSAGRLLHFQAVARRQFGKGVDVPHMLAAAKSEEGRAKLRACYDAIWRDHNLVSMALYAGPLHTPTWPERVARTIEDHWGLRRDFERLPRELGWLATGDFQLAVDIRRHRFLDFYRAILPRVDVFVVPHHGAATSFDRITLKDLSNLSVGIAAAGPNGYGHPHIDVIDAVRRAGASFQQVSNDERSLASIEVFG
jgi:hypothetical protein